MRRHLKLLAGFGASALLLHLVALGGLQWTWAQRPSLPTAAVAAGALAELTPSARVPSVPVPSVPAPSVPAPSVQVRVLTAALPPRGQVDAAAPAELAVPSLTPSRAPSPATSPAPAPIPAPARRVPPRAAAAPVAADPAPVAVLTVAQAASPAPSQAPAPAAPLPVDTRVALNLAAVATVAAAPGPAAAQTEPQVALDATLPLYRTQPPPSTLLRYALRRGVLHGSGEMLWRVDGGHYELRLDGRVGPLSVLTQTSSGGFDAAGLAPLRFTDKRLRRATAATNFQREAGKLTFSGPSTEFPLRAGLQDRLSWMVQLAAIVAAEPALRSAAAKVLMGVVGVNADPAVWVFRCLGRESVDTEAGAVDAIKYVRDPHDLHDTTVQVWLDPQRHYLPVHATQKSGPTDEEFSLRLLESASLP